MQALIIVEGINSKGVILMESLGIRVRGFEILPVGSPYSSWTATTPYLRRKRLRSICWSAALGFW